MSEDNNNQTVDIPEVENVEPVTIDLPEVEDIETPMHIEVEATEVPSNELDKPTSEVKLPKGREVFIQDAKVEINSQYVILMHPDIDNPDILGKCYPNASNDIDSSMAHIIAGYVADHEVQGVKVNNGILSNVIVGNDGKGEVRKTAITKPKPLLNGSTLIGEDAVLAITSSLGLGGRIEIPLVNSSFRIELKRPTGDDLMILDEQLLTNKGEFGRLTFGASLSFTACYLQRDIVNAALRLMVRHNLEGVAQGDIEGIRKRIDHRDYHTLILGFLCGSNPDGLNTNVPCTSEVDTCSYITAGRTLPPRMFFVDHGKLTDNQLEIITRPMSVMVSDEDYASYRNDFKTENDFYEFKKQGVLYRFNYKQPSIEDNLRAGMKWAANINKLVNRFISGSDEPNIRKRVLNKELNINTLSQFGGWIESLTLTNEETGKLLVKVEDQDTIIDTLKSIYVDEDAVEALDAIRKFIHNTNPVTIGVPNFICPSCKSVNSEIETVIVPVDIEALFFIHSIDQALMASHFELLGQVM